MKEPVNVRKIVIGIRKKTETRIKNVMAKTNGYRRRLWMLMCRGFCQAAAHKEAMGYYAVLTLVLIALGAAANDYRSRKINQQMAEALTYAEPGVAVQMQSDPTLAPDVQAPEYILPVQGTVVRGFSERELTWSTTLQLWQTHPAVDIAAAVGEAVVAAADGTVTEAYSESLYGNVIVITHEDGSKLRYSSLNTLQLVKVGSRVMQGDIISAVGTCSAESEIGAHIHLEYFVNQRPVDFMLLMEKR